MLTAFTRNSAAIHALSAYVISIMWACWAADATAADPFDTLGLAAAGPADSQGRGLRVPCQKVPISSALTLTDVVEQALCNNPQTRLAWINTRVQVAQVGIAQSAFLPNLTANVSRSRNDTSSPQPSFNQTSGSLSINYLLYDFGGREATLENARQLMSALAATQDATLQSVFLSAVQAYYQRYAAAAAVTAARDSLRASEESLQAAEARYRIGTNTPADRLQAQTAASQAKLTLIQAEANAKTSIGVLANVMGIDANASPAIAEPGDNVTLESFERNIDELITAAKHSRPDLAAAEAQVKAAHANIAAVNSSGMPSVSLFANRNYNDGGMTDALRSNAIGVAVSIPLFSGFNTTYRQRAAEAQLEAKATQFDQLSRQVSLDVWRAYYALQSGTAAVRASADLVASAEASEKMTAGRYKAGYGAILDLLNAQSALASARQQQIQAQFNWRIAKAAMAQALGELDFSRLQTSGK
jgi:TolC family type I secretion outer membrane protein